MFFVLFQRIFPRYFFLRVAFVIFSLFSLPSLTHASITPSLSPSRTTGVAPLSVFFDASGTTASSTTLPFHELDYSWNFGDDDTVTWDYGTRPGVNKKNRAYGPESAHVFEPTSFPDDCTGTPCKIFTVTLTVYDGTDTTTTTQAISVTDPDAVFGGNTFCINASGTDHTGCPLMPGTYADSAACITAGKCLTQVSFSTAMTTYIATGVRLLFKKGDVFTANANGDIDVDGPGLVGAYGSGAKPIIQLMESYAAFRLSGPTTPNIDDWRIMNMDIDGQSYADSYGVFGRGNINQVTIIRVSMHHVGVGFSFSPSFLDYYNNNGNPGHGMFDQLTVSDSSISTIIGGSGGNGFFVAASHMAILGNSLYDTSGGEHNFRTMFFDKMVLAHNSFEKPAPTKAVLTLRAQDWDCVDCVALPPHTYSQYALISDNEFIAGPGVNSPVNTSIDSGHDARTQNIIFERNWWHGFIAGGTALSLNSSYSTIRNNVIDITTGSGLGSRCISVSNNGGSSPNPTDNQIYNNICFNNDTASGFTSTIRNVHLFSTAINTIVKNNLHYTPNAAIATTNTISVDNAGVNTIGASGTFGNSSDVQAKTSPLFLNSSGTFSQPGDFIPTTGSYALASGTTVPVYRDFYNNLRGATMDMGAFKQDSDPNDTTPPILSSITANVTSDTTATITWTTNELSDSTVNYGTTDAYGQTSTSASNITSHSRSLTGLTPGTIYHFEVISTDPSTNTTTSADQTFTTTGINPVIAPSRTTGVAPLSVFFDASGTTASSTTLPFHELDYSWNFGDDDTATWTYGTRPGVNKKNRAYGPESAHVFEPTSFPDDCTGTPCKIFTVTLTVYDGTDTVTTTQAISVTDPDAVFGGVNTVCVNNVGDSDFIGCPSGADTQNTNDYITAQGYITGPVRRLLFKAGGTWTKVTTTAMSVAGPGLIGSYGSGAKPIILGALELRLTNSDWRVMNLQIDCQNAVASHAIFPPSGLQQLYYKLDITNCASALDAGGAGTEGIDQLFFVDNTYQNGSVINGEQVAMMGSRQVVMGNSINGNLLSYHALRVHYADKGVFSNNYFSGTNSSVETASLRAPDYDRVTGSPNPVTRNVLFSHNEISANGNSAITVKTATDINGHIENVIIENNYTHIPIGSVAGSGIGVVTGSNISIRNNVVDMTHNYNVSNNLGISVSWLFTNPPKPDYIWIYNNSIYNIESYASFRGIAIGTDPTHVVIRNNLAYAPNAGTNQIMLGDAGSVGLLQSGNSTDSSGSNQIKNTNPFSTATPTTLSDFIPTTGSYALASGTTVPVYRDFYNNLRGATMDMGAFKQDSTIQDTTPPTLTESSTIATSTDTTPDYTFSTTEGGSLTYGGDCTSSTTTATSGTNTITFSTLSAGTHTNCTLTVTDASTNASTPLAITSFTITEETIPTPEVAGTSSSSKSKAKKKKISGNITYKKGERSAPWITLLTPTSNTATNKKFTIKATSKDKSGIQAMFVSINGIKKKRMNTDSILYTAKKRQNASITVSAYDTLGNVKIAQITITDGKVSGVRYY